MQGVGMGGVKGSLEATVNGRIEFLGPAGAARLSVHLRHPPGDDPLHPRLYLVEGHGRAYRPLLLFGLLGPREGVTAAAAEVLIPPREPSVIRRGDEGSDQLAPLKLPEVDSKEGA